MYTFTASLKRLIKIKEMSKPLNRILPGIQSFSFNADGSKVAVCPRTAEILIFKTNGSSNIKDWTLLQVLKEVSTILEDLSLFAIALRNGDCSRLAPCYWLAPV